MVPHSIQLLCHIINVKKKFVKSDKNCGGASMSFCSCQCDLIIYTKNCNIFWSRQMAWGIKGSAQVVQNGVWSFLVTLISKINDPCNWVTLGYSKFEKFWLEESNYFFQKSFLVSAYNENCWNVVSVLADLNDNWLLPIFNGLFLISFSILMSFSKGKKQKLYHQSCDKLKILSTIFI